MIKTTNLTLNSRGHFKKLSIPVSVRFALAEKHGCNPGFVIKVKCAYCESICEIHWIVQPADRARGWVSFYILEMDHVKAEFFGGESTIENIVLACLPFNRSKSSKTLKDWKAK